MGKDLFPHVFGLAKLDYSRLGSWYKAIIANKTVYTDCYVPSFTRVKNLGSEYMHEYIQFIVENHSAGKQAGV
jgi:hypothetical protein